MKKNTAFLIAIALIAAFAGLVYPVTRFGAAGLNTKSAEMLMGANPAAAALARYDTVPRVTADLPPLFFVHAFDDPIVPMEQSLEMMAAARAVKVPVEAHLIERGGHGFGALHLPQAAPGRSWPDIFAKWIADRG